MNAPRIIPAGPMPHDAILPLIREVGSLRERGEYGAAAELEERIRQPITVAGRVLEPCLDGGFYWTDAGEPSERVSLMAYDDEWRATLMADGPHTLHQVYGAGLTIAAALADARERYMCAIDATLLRMGGLLREVTL
jgi:hypothetical protein